MGARRATSSIDVFEELSQIAQYGDITDGWPKTIEEEQDTYKLTLLITACKSFILPS